VVEAGSHDELLQRNGLYAQLHQVQTRWRDRSRARRVAEPAEGIA